MTKGWVCPTRHRWEIADMYKESQQSGDPLGPTVKDSWAQSVQKMQQKIEDVRRSSSFRTVAAQYSYFNQSWANRIQRVCYVR